jgi:hypothetical protein
LKGYCLGRTYLFDIRAASHPEHERHHLEVVDLRPAHGADPAAYYAAAGHPDIGQHDLGGVRGPDPCLRNFCPMASPAVPGGTMKLACPRDSSDGSTDATTTCTLAMPPLVASRKRRDP